MEGPRTPFRPRLLSLEVSGDTVRASGDVSYRCGHRLPDASDEAGHASWTWDGSTLRVSTCRFGLHTIFYVHRRREFVISNSLVEVLRWTGRNDVDDDAVAVFLRLGFFLEDDSPFRDIKVVPPGADWQWRAGVLARQRPTLARVAGSVPAGRARTDDFIDLFRGSMRRRPPLEDVVLPLSGGRDSRHILFELLRSGARRDARSFRCVSSEFPPTRSLEDVRVARLLCRDLGVEHHVVAQGHSFLAQSVKKNLLTSFCSDEHSWAVPMSDWVNRAKATLYDGIGGDVLSAGLFSSRRRVDLLRAGRVEEFVLDVFGDAELELKCWLSPRGRVRFSRERALARAAAAVGRHLEAPNPIAAFFFWNRTRREIALHSCCMYRPDTRVYYPYLDDDLYDYLASIPAEELADKSFHSRAIAEGYPQWSHYPYGHGDADAEAVRLPASIRRRWNSRLALEAGGYLLKRRGGWVDGAAVVPRLARLVGAVDTGRRFWLNIERILWAAQLSGDALPGWSQAR